jgi:phosphoenolpyruvate---glycerone phosphotransferase subunit DhaL
VGVLTVTVTRDQILAWLSALQQVYAENRDMLTQLDSAVGDADHGTNMDRGFTAVKREMAAGAPEDIRGILQKVATILIKHIGGASGPLYGTFFLRASAAVPAGKTEVDPLLIFEPGIEGVRQRGKAEPGDKTMVDVLVPAMEAMRTGGLDAAVAAAESALQGTIPLQARKGRASYLGARSVGHQDPGATSAFLMIRAAAESFGA